LRLCVCIGVLFPVFLAVGATSSILEMTPPISGLALADLQDTFEEVHNGHRHEAIDILEPRGTPVHVVVSGIIRKLFLSKQGGSTIYQFDEMGVHCYYYAHLDRYVEGLREGMRVERGDVIGFVESTGNADARTRSRPDWSLNGKVQNSVETLNKGGGILERYAFHKKSLVK
jgi:murein DD-endopeptidase MepM/ murein hydrolase activator NlpD